MKLPISWLKDFVDIEVSPQELEKKLIASGFEVEEIDYIGKEISACVVGQITSLEKHQDSDHLQICKLDCGNFGKDIQIVTGAQNVFVGAKVPVALNGSTLVGGIKIKSGKLRGVESNGMLCSGEELGIDEEFFDGAGFNGILILPDTTPLGMDIKDVVGLNDWIFDISITANRPDCQSIFGMAREVACILNKKLKNPSYFYVEKENNHENFSVSVKAPELCPRYMAHIVDNIKLEKSPILIRQRLKLCGINAINNIVDITNYVLLEMGQPMHAFDMKNLAGNEIIVRTANEGEIITTLDEKDFELHGNNLVICDKEKPVALAGIMGGLHSGINENTNTIVFESAKFMRENIRKTSRALGQASDSSRRFEKGVDEYTCELALNRALNLIDSLKCGNVSTARFDIYAQIKKPTTVHTSFEKINKILGITVPKESIIKILKSLNFETVVLENGNFSTIAPPYREDVDGEADIAEEIIRIYGYEHITPTTLEITNLTKGGLTQEQKDTNKIKNTFVSLGYNEIITYSFYGEKDLNAFNIPQDAVERQFIKLQNPLTEDIEIMKTIFAPSTAEILVKNIKKGNESAKLFEVGNIYIPKSLPVNELPNEVKTLSLGAYGDNYNFFNMKGELENFAEAFGLKFEFVRTNKAFLHPYISANIMLNEQVIGFVGQIAYDITEKLQVNQKLIIAELNLDKFFVSLTHSVIFKPITKHQSIKRDLALKVKNEIANGQIEKIMYNASKKITDIKLFDIYTGNQVESGYKSMAYTLTFTPDENPLTHEEVDKIVEKLLRSLNTNLNVVLRT